MPRADIAGLLDGPPGRAVLAWRHHPRQPVAFTIEARATAHLSHEPNALQDRRPPLNPPIWTVGQRSKPPAV